MNKNILSTAALSLVALVLSGCGVTVVEGSGRIKTEARAVSGFERVELTGSGQVILVQGETEGVTVETDDNVLAYVQAEVRGKTLYLSLKNGLGELVWPSQAVKYYVNAKEVAGLTITGSGEIRAESVKTDELALAINGSGDIYLNTLTAQAVMSRITGSGKCEVGGTTQAQTVAIDGSGNYRAADLVSATADVTITGSGNITLQATETLNARITGSGEVNYYGQPKIVERITGSGTVRSRSK